MSNNIKLAMALLTAGICLSVNAGPLEKPGMTAKEKLGYRLFDHNCAQCHGDDARGDEGPDLHGLTKSDKRVEKIIKEGIKGEMPAFGKKFNDQDVKDLITWLRTLKD